MNKPIHPSDPGVVSPVKTNETTMAASTIDDYELERPTEAEEQCLRRVSGKVPWMAYSIAFVEMCERFSFFGTTAVCKLLLFLWDIGYSPDQTSLVVNFIQQPLPEVSTTGAAGNGTQPGALGQGQQASTGLTTCKCLLSFSLVFYANNILDSQYLLVLRDADPGSLDCR